MIFNNFKFVGIITLLILSAFNLSANQTNIPTEINKNSSIDEIISELKQMNIPILTFSFEENKFPTYDVINAPEGCIGTSITNNAYVKGSLVISIGEDEIYNSGEYVNKESGVRVKYRGNTSTAQDYIKKKSFKIKLSKKADLLFRDDKKYKDKDWVLLNGNKDINYVIGTKVARICGMDWEPSGRSVCVIMNNQYMGYYYLVEAVNASETRVNIDDTGFIIENDAYWWKPDEVYFKTKNLPTTVGWTFKEPDTDEMDDQDIEKIRNLVQIFENSLYKNEDIEEMYDKDSFSNWILSHDILGTTDSSGSNIFVTKENYNGNNLFETKLRMGPLWDFDECFKSSDTHHAAVFYSNNFWFPQLFMYSDFYENFLTNWNSVRNKIIPELKLEIENYLSNNPDIYKVRCIDKQLGLLDPYSLSDPEDDFNNKLQWIENRLSALENIYKEIKVLKIKINPNTLELKKRESFILEPIIYPSNATNQDISWTSSNPSVAIVTNQGQVIAFNKGITNIQATCGNVTDICEVYVDLKSGIEDLLNQSEEIFSIYTLEGLLIKEKCKFDDLQSLSKGIYIIVSEKERYKIII